MHLKLIALQAGFLSLCHHNQAGRRNLAVSIDNQSCRHMILWTIRTYANRLLEWIRNDQAEKGHKYTTTDNSETFVNDGSLNLRGIFSHDFYC